MKRFFLKFGVLAAVFVAGVLLFTLYLNRDRTAGTRSAENPSLPVAYMVTDGITVNMMHACTETLNEDTMRESLTLLPSGRSLNFQLQYYDNSVESISYQVTSLADGSLVENGKIKDISDNGSVKEGSFTLDTPILMNREYMLRLTAELSGGKPLYFYTRIIQRSGLNISGYLEYVQNFYEACLRKELSEEQIGQLEPRASAASSSLHSVNIHSSRDQITWGALNPQLVKKAVPRICEINDTTVSLALDYLISAQNGTGQTEYYNVEEFYRMRYGQDAVVLLNFERTCTQQFDGTLPVLEESGILLGVVGSDVVYKTNSDADIAAFIQDGDLWLYDRGANKTMRIFSFRGTGEADERTENANHEIEIVSVSDEGDVTFIVYGYMNSGEHEGRSGLAAYIFHARRNVAEEVAFIPAKDSFAYMKQSMSKLTYLNDNSILYFYLEDTIYRVDLKRRTAEILLTRIDPACLAVSDSQQSAAWMNAMEPDASDKITMIDFTTGEQAEIKAPGGQKVRALDYVNEDLICGYAYDGDIRSDEAGNTTFAMYALRITGFDGTVKKEYAAEGYYVTDIRQDNGLIELKRVARSGSGYVPAENDHIINHVAEGEESVSVALSVDERKGTEVSLVFTVKGKTRNLLVLNVRYLDSGNKEISVPDGKPAGTKYAVYGNGRLLETADSPAKAVTLANENVGTVLDEKQIYVYERGNYAASVQLDPAVIPEPLLTAPLSAAAVAGAAGEKAVVMNLTGVPMETLYYVVSSGSPVCAATENGSILITGYDNFNIWYYDTSLGENKAIAKEDAEVMFAAAGNIFVTYYTTA